jgi:hypothetical protein
MKHANIRYGLVAVMLLTFGSLAFSQQSDSSASGWPLGHDIQCLTSVPQGICGPYAYPLVTGSDGYNVNVQNDFWNYENSTNGAQVMYVASPKNWYVVANFPKGNTAVMTYPDSDAIYNAPLISSYSYLYSSFGEWMQTSRDSSVEAAYDIWLNGYSNEVMIWTDIDNRSLAGCTPLASQISFGGSNGIPEHVWNLCQYGGSELVWELDQPSLGRGTSDVFGITHGSVDVLAMLTYLMNNGYLPTTTTLTQLEYGFEICSTGGANQIFQVNNWSVTASHP